MTYDEILKRFTDGNVVVPGKKVKFDFAEAGKIFLDGSANKVSADDGAAEGRRSAERTVAACGLSAACGPR